MTNPVRTLTSTIKTRESAAAACATVSSRSEPKSTPAWSPVWGVSSTLPSGHDSPTARARGRGSIDNTRASVDCAIRTERDGPGGTNLMLPGTTEIHFRPPCSGHPRERLRWHVYVHDLPTPSRTGSATRMPSQSYDARKCCLGATIGTVQKLALGGSRYSM